MEYKLHGEISLKDFIQFNKSYKKHGSALIIRLVVYPALVIFVVVSLLPNWDFLKYYLPKFSSFELLKIFSPFLFLAVFLILLFTVIMPLIYKKHYNENKNIHQTFNITVNEQCITISSETGNTKLTKENINKILYDKDSIYVYSALNMGHIIKKRYLENEDDFAGLVEFVKINFGKSKKDAKG
jgi:hypothetical protein